MLLARICALRRRAPCPRRSATATRSQQPRTSPIAKLQVNTPNRHPAGGTLGLENLLVAEKGRCAPAARSARRLGHQGRFGDVFEEFGLTRDHSGEDCPGDPQQLGHLR